MKLTRFEEVGILVTAEVAGANNTWITLSDIGKKHGISQAFLKKVTRLLRTSHILISREGIGGGYRLAKPPAEITVYDVFFALGTTKKDSMAASARICPLQPYCLPQKIRQQIEETFLTYCDNVTIDQFIKKGLYE